MNTTTRKFLQKNLSNIIHNMLKRWETVWCHITELDELNGFKGEIMKQRMISNTGRYPILDEDIELMKERKNLLYIVMCADKKRKELEVEI